MELDGDPGSGGDGNAPAPPMGPMQSAGPGDVAAPQTGPMQQAGPPVVAAPIRKSPGMPKTVMTSPAAPIIRRITSEIGNEFAHLARAEGAAAPLVYIPSEAYKVMSPGTVASVASYTRVVGHFRVPGWSVALQPGATGATLANEYVHAIARHKITPEGLQAGIDNLEQLIYGWNLPNWEQKATGTGGWAAALRYREAAYGHAGIKTPLQMLSMEQFHKRYWDKSFKKAQAGRWWWQSKKDTAAGNFQMSNKELTHLLEERLSHLASIRYNQLTNNKEIGRLSSLKFFTYESKHLSSEKYRSLMYSPGSVQVPPGPVNQLAQAAQLQNSMSGWKK